MLLSIYTSKNRHRFSFNDLFSSSDNESLNVDLLYVNERHSKLFLETKTVRIVSLQESSIALLKKNKTVTMETIVSNVTAVCKVPKFCQELTCDLNDYVFYHKADLLELPQNRTLVVGQKIEVSCATRTTNLTVFCMNKGYLVPHPTNILCSASEDEIVETAWNRRVRSSCAECYAFGTERCIRVEGGVTCQCREGWRDFTCWRTPNQCKMTGLTCEHGKCQSQIDRVSRYGYWRVYEFMISVSLLHIM